MTCRRALVHASAASALCLAAIAAGKYLPPGWAAALLLAGTAYGLRRQIGRASCRERV